MSFKKFNEMELALLSAIASMTEEDAEDIEVENGDIIPVAMEDCISIPFYITKPNSARHAKRRKYTFKKKVEQKTLARDLGYDLSAVRTSKKVEDLLSANHDDKGYFRGSKTKRKYMTVREEKALMEQEDRELARDSMEEEHDSILGAIACDIDTLTLDMKSNEYHIENLKTEYKELEEAMKLVSEKLQNAYLRKNGIQAALASKEEELNTLSANLKRERISHFGW